MGRLNSPKVLLTLLVERSGSGFAGLRMILFSDEIGPRDTTAASEGMYAESANGIDTIRRVEKLSKPASTFTSSAMAGISRSHAVKRF
jgi:hypothetical protein